MERLGAWLGLPAGAGDRAAAERVLALVGASAIALKLLSGATSLAWGASLASIPAVKRKIAQDAQDAVSQMFDPTALSAPLAEVTAIPKLGMERENVLEILRALSLLDCKAEDGRVFAYTYTSGEDGHHAFQNEASKIFANENALNPMAFPALKRFEVEIVQMGLALMNAPEGAAGSVTSGGTESILLAIKTYRDYAREHRGIRQPEMILPRTAHPAFEKASKYFDVKTVYIREDPKTFLPDIGDFRRAINKNTILLVGSAPQYPHGVVDPITEIAALAIERGLPCHVDSCIGGWVLPFVKKLGYDVPDWDFSVPGVTSISADLHKYGYAPKGASVILYHSEELRQYQYFVYAGWPGGLFASPSMLGTRGGGAIAGAWATLLTLGEDGYLRATKKIMDTRQFILDALAGEQLRDDLELLAKPHSTLISFAAKGSFNILAVADVMEDDFAWKIERQQDPASIHLSLMPQHAAIKEKFVQDLIASVAKVKKNPDLAKKGTAAMYGMVASVPSDAIIEQFMGTFLSKVYSPVSTKSEVVE